MTPCTSILVAAGFVMLSFVHATPAQAQSKDGTRSYDLSQPGSHRLRNYSVRNGSGDTVEWAELRLTDGSARTVTDKRPLANSHAEVVGAPGAACLADVHVRFAGGRTLDVTNLNDCDQTQVFIERDRIAIRSSASPGP